MHVVSVSRRTDIAAFYMPWFMNRVREGWCEWYNPFNAQPRRVSLSAADVLRLVFWTRYPAPLLPHVSELSERGYRFYVHVTINGYPRELESHNPELPRARDAFRRLAHAIGAERVHWRYDPILISSSTPADWHRDNFERLAAELAGYTKRCYFSFVDVYGKTERNLARIGVSAADPPGALAPDLAAIAAAHGIGMYACCEDACTGGLIEKAHCVSPELLGLDTPLKSAPTREQCGCYQSVDIGAYDTCLFGCAYCYATNSRDAALRRRAAHDPAAPALWMPACR